MKRIEGKDGVVAGRESVCRRVWFGVPVWAKESIFSTCFEGCEARLQKGREVISVPLSCPGGPP